MEFAGSYEFRNKTLPHRPFSSFVLLHVLLVLPHVFFRGALLGHLRGKLHVRQAPELVLIFWTCRVKFPREFAFELGHLENLEGLIRNLTLALGDKRLTCGQRSPNLLNEDGYSSVIMRIGSAFLASTLRLKEFW